VSRFEHTPGNPFGRLGPLTYSEVLRLPHTASVLLRNGQRGRIVSWRHTAEAVAVAVGATRYVVPCHALELRADGSVAEIDRPQPPPFIVTPRNPRGQGGDSGGSSATS